MKYQILIDSEIVGKDGKTERELPAGTVVADLPPAQVKGLTANGAIEAAGKRARDEDGHFVGDDPETPTVNEAWEEE